MTDLTRRTLLAGAAATGALAATASFAQDDKLDTLP
ncbi:MAG TPA: short-chain dehydrogenase/reductase, partial [Erythrobacter sp.]|nr:short-chain dehydrogenase/reductase [Erythrobacter sp.]